jgi:hypothetical protein
MLEQLVGIPKRGMTGKGRAEWVPMRVQLRLREWLEWRHVCRCVLVEVLVCLKTIRSLPVIGTVVVSAMETVAPGVCGVAAFAWSVVCGWCCLLCV